MKWKWLTLVLLLLLLGGGVGYYQWHKKNVILHQYDTYIFAAARRYQVDPALIKAVIWKESEFRANARGKSGEFGLMQIRDLAAQEWADAEKIYPFNPETLLDARTNTFAGTFYLAKLMRRYAHTDNPVAYALADYNAGRSNVLKWYSGAALTNSQVFVQQIGFPMTRSYVLSIVEKIPVFREDLRQQEARRIAAGR